MIDEGDFPAPKVRNTPGGTSSGDSEPFEKNSDPRGGGTDGASSGSRDTFKANTEKVNTEKANTELKDAPKPADPDLVIPEKKPAPTGEAVEEKSGPQTLRLDSRITSKAVSPRERQTIVVGFQKPVVARTKAPATNWAGNPRTTDLAQHR